MALNKFPRFFQGLREDIKLLRGLRYNRADEAQHMLAQSSRQRRSGFVAYRGILLAGLFIVWIMVNLLASGLSPRLNIDASDDQIYSLSDTSQEILAGLEQPVTIYALFAQGQRPTQPLDLYRYLELYSGPYVKIQEVDPELEPELIRPFITGKRRQGRGSNQAPKRNSLIVFTRDSQPRFRVIDYRDMYYVMERFGPQNAGIRAEQQISSAIAYVNGSELTKLGFLQGHREQGLEVLQANFMQYNIEAGPINATLEPKSLRDLDVLLVYKPQLDLSGDEYRSLHRYLEQGKALWLILDFQAEFLPNFYQLSKEYGIEILEGLVLERDPKRIQAAAGYTTFVTPISSLIPASEDEELHPILKPLLENKIQDLLWSQSMAVRESLPRPHRMRFYNLVESSRSSLLRSSRDPSSTAQIEGDLSGPLTLMGLSVWQDEQGQRAGPALLVSFDTPGAKSVNRTPSNLQLFYSALAWLGDPGVASQLIFPSKSLLMLPLRLSQAQAIWWGSAFVILLPLLFLLAGLSFLQRRKQL